VEYAWNKTKKKITDERFFAKLTDLKAALASRYKGFQGNPPFLRRIIPCLA
jgi:hypothetical protein